MISVLFFVRSVKSAFRWAFVIALSRKKNRERNREIPSRAQAGFDDFSIKGSAMTSCSPRLCHARTFKAWCFHFFLIAQISGAYLS